MTDLRAVGASSLTRTGTIDLTRVGAIGSVAVRVEC
jgi:hypothetical protein